MFNVKVYSFFKDKIKFKDDKNFFVNGIDNLFPEQVEELVTSSVTAHACTQIFKKYLYGKGLDSYQDLIVNPKKQTLNDFYKHLVSSYVIHNGAFVHVNYNADFNISSLEALPYSECRVGKKDDNNYNGKIIVSQNWKNEKTYKTFDVFNPSKEVIKNQIIASKGIENYQGQILFFNPDNTIYPRPHVNSVLNDLETEIEASKYKLNTIKKGFHGKKMIVTPQMIDENLRNTLFENLTENDQKELRRQQKASQEVKDNLNKFIGSENDSVMLFESSSSNFEKIDDQIKFVDIASNINDKIFEYTEKSVSNNIRKAINNVPSILIESNDSAVFGQSGELLKQSKLFYQQQVEGDKILLRDKVLTPLCSLIDKIQEIPNINPLILEDELVSDH